MRSYGNVSAARDVVRNNNKEVVGLRLGRVGLTQLLSLLSPGSRNPLWVSSRRDEHTAASVARRPPRHGDSRHGHGGNGMNIHRRPVLHPGGATPAVRRPPTKKQKGGSRRRQCDDDAR
ncbi:hypothetical protein EYF80_038362 [Liparis tanakae]|uniref:Uncharacterized protein n=1 Tax=Liparis tanakae TaxID=230148 RepID=A0A4Z2GDV5_9TELE|nr:hypothetical protein EYF80_038362 [Liparis tanakae]